ncbi:MAG: histidine ammonia-lyase [Candidatus Eremiobacterota bacterium]
MTFRLHDVVRVARHGEQLVLSPEVRQRIQASRRVLEGAIQEGRSLYGITTGVGDLSATPVDRGDSCRLSRNILMSHACGVGAPLPAEQVRAILVAAVANWAQGLSGVRLELVDAVLDLLNRGVTPWMPSQGGMGSLTHMAHAGLVLMGMGRAYYAGELLPGEEALTRAGLLPVQPAEKEGLSLVNGTPAKTGLGCLAARDALRLADWADLAGAMSLEALGGQLAAFDPRVHRARAHPGQEQVAESIRQLTRGSQVLQKAAGARVQDALSLRCIPQVHGACRDALRSVVSVLETELNSATDNPLVFEDGSVVSACNAHGEPVALALEQLALAVAELASISERRTDRLVSPHLSGLPAFLVRSGGLNSGFMIAQYVAASLVAENKVLCHPVVADSIPTGAMQEDHWSMGTPAARKALAVVANAQKVVAVELLTAAQALEFQRPLRFGQGVEAGHARVRSLVPPWEEDREFYPDLEAVIRVVETRDPP